MSAVASAHVRMVASLAETSTAAAAAPKASQKRRSAKLTIEQRWTWWETIGSPRYCCAPMVLQSELAFRMLVRKHGCSLCYAPMLPVQAFVTLPADGPAIVPATGGPATQAAYFTTCATDRPLLAQLGGSDPSQMLAAARLIQDRVDGIDVNFGCPQKCAATGGYGAFLLDHPDRAREIIETLVAGLRVPVTAKIRIFPDVADTVAFALMLQEAGVAALAVHGRLREQRHHEGAANLTAIAAVKKALDIPVIANGNVRCRTDAEAVLAATGADCVMSATSLLTNPRLFGDDLDIRDIGDGMVSVKSDDRPSRSERAEMALEYLECAKEWPDGALPRMISDHLLEILGPDLAQPFNADLKKEIKDWRGKSGPRAFASSVKRVQANGAWQDTLVLRGACGKLVRYPKGEALEGSLVRFCPEPD